MNYTADTLFALQRQQALNVRYSELLKRKDVDNRSGDEIVEDVMKQGGLRFEE